MVYFRVNRKDAVRVYGVVALVIVVHDVVEFGGFGHISPLIKFARIGPEIGVFAQPFSIAFKMGVIDWIKADQGCEQPPVCFRYVIFYQVTI